MLPPPREITINNVVFEVGLRSEDGVPNNWIHIRPKDPNADKNVIRATLDLAKRRLDKETGDMGFVLLGLEAQYDTPPPDLSGLKAESEAQLILRIPEKNSENTDTIIKTVTSFLNELAHNSQFQNSIEILRQLSQHNRPNTVRNPSIRPLRLKALPDKNSMHNHIYQALRDITNSPDINSAEISDDNLNTISEITEKFIMDRIQRLITKWDRGSEWPKLEMTANQRRVDWLLESTKELGILLKQAVPALKEPENSEMLSKLTNVIMRKIDKDYAPEIEEPQRGVG